MFEAQLVVAKSSTYDLYSPWFPRGGDNLAATIDLIAASDTSGSTKISAKIVTKNLEDPGDGGTPVSGDVGRTAAELAAGNPRETAVWDGLVEELVRYRFTVQGNTAGEWLLFRMLPPVWFDSVEG